MHYKRGRARRRRAGCKLCKPWKMNGFATERLDGECFSDHRRRVAAALDMRMSGAVGAVGWAQHA